MTSDTAPVNISRLEWVDSLHKLDVPSIVTLKEAIQKESKDSLDNIAEVVLFPFCKLFKSPRPSNEDLLVESLQCVQYVLSNVSLKNSAAVIDILTSVSKLVFSIESKALAGSEELKKGVVGVFKALFDKGAALVAKSLYHAPTIALLGYVVTILLSIANNRIDRSTRIMALLALQSLCDPPYSKALGDAERNALITQIADTVACILPGVWLGMVKVISDQSSGQKVRCVAMEVLSTFIVSTIGDAAPKSAGPLTEELNPNLRRLVVKRDEKWTKQAADGLGKILEIICSSSNSSEVAVRMSCVEFSGRILLECSRSMENHTVVLLNVCVKLMNDEFPQVRDLCDDILNRFSTMIQNDRSRRRVFAEILEENIFALSTSLPRIIRSGDDAEKLSHLRILLGYITLLKAQINKLILSFAHLSKLSSALLHCLELDHSVIQLLEVTPTDCAPQELTRSCFRKRFKHFRDDRIYKVLSDICKNLGRYGDIEILTDHFMDVYNSSEANCKQAVLVILHMVTGVVICEENSRKLLDVIKSILDEFLSPNNWYLVTSFDSDYLDPHVSNKLQKWRRNETSNEIAPAHTSSSFQQLSSKFVKNNVILSCVHLDAILAFSRTLKSVFRQFLMYVLYPLLEKTVDQDETLSLCAVRAMGGIALNCGYRSSSELIAENADYLISDMSIQIHKLRMFPRCPAVLCAILNHSDSKILPLVYDTVDEIVEALDLHHLEPRKLLVFVPVLSAVANGVNRWMAENSSSKTNCGELNTRNQSGGSVNGDKTACKDSRLKKTSFVTELKNQLLQLRENSKIASLETEPEIDPDWQPDPDGDLDPDPDEDKKPDEPPIEIRVVTKVLTRCGHLMAHSDPRIRMRVMDVINSGMLALSKFRNELLPMAHKIWNPLAVRFGDDELQVVIKAFDTMCIVASHAKEFLRKRFSKDILPKLLSTLESQAASSRKVSISHGNDILMPGRVGSNVSRNAVAYKHSVLFKLQRKVLSELGPLLLDLDVNRKDHIRTCKSLKSYLSCRQPAELQESAVRLFTHLIRIDSDLTWLELTRIWCHSGTVSPKDSMDVEIANCDSLRTIYLGGSTDPHHECSSNVKKLLKLCCVESTCVSFSE